MWIKLDCELDSHPKSQKAGFWGLTVTTALWRICKKYNKPGILSRHHYDIDFLAEFLRAEEYKKEIEDGIDCAIESGYFKRLGDNKLEVVGWDDFQATNGSKPIVETKELSDETGFDNPRTQKMYDAIRANWPTYRVQHARESAARLSAHFKDIDIPRVMSGAAALWGPGRGLTEKSGLHGFLYSFFTTEKERMAKQNSSAPGKKFGDEHQKMRPYHRIIKDNDERPVNKATPEDIRSLIKGSKFLTAAKEKDAEAEEMLAGLGIPKPEGA